MVLTELSVERMAKYTVGTTVYALRPSTSRIRPITPLSLQQCSGKRSVTLRLHPTSFPWSRRDKPGESQSLSLIIASQLCIRSDGEFLRVLFIWESLIVPRHRHSSGIPRPIQTFDLHTKRKPRPDPARLEAQLLTQRP